MSSKSTKIYIGNLVDSCKVDQLKELFGKYGQVEECDIIKNYGFVHMSSDEETKDAIQALNGSEFLGNKISVELSHSKVRPKPGMGGKGQCYRCGKSGHWSKECPRNSEERFREWLGFKRYMPYGYNRVNPTARSRPFNHYERLQYCRHYYRDYFEDVFDGRPFDHPFNRRPMPGVFRRLPFEYLYDRRNRFRFDQYFDERSYPEYSDRRPEH